MEYFASSLIGGVIGIFLLSKIINFFLFKIRKSDTVTQRTIIVIISVLIAIIIWTLTSGGTEHYFQGIIGYLIGGVIWFFGFALRKINNLSLALFYNIRRGYKFVKLQL